MNLMDFEAFQAAYPGWLEETRPLLEAADWKASFKNYPFVVNADAPWTPWEKNLAESRVALLTTAGLYVKGEQQPFTAGEIEGDWTFRELPGDASVDQLSIAHDHYPHTHADQDRNSVFPLDRMNELVAEGVIGELAPRHFSISGYCTRVDLLAERSIPSIVMGLQQDRVDAVLHIPV